MPREQYDLNEEAYQETLAQKTIEIDTQLLEEGKKNDAKIRQIEAQARENYKLSERTRDTSAKDKANSERALEVQRQGRERLMQSKRERLIKEAVDKIEIIIFGKKWGRLEARELAYGAEDPLVKDLRKQKLEYDRQQNPQRENSRVLLEDEHKLETLKGKYTEHFNDKDRMR